MNIATRRKGKKERETLDILLKQGSCDCLFKGRGYDLERTKDANNTLKLLTSFCTST